MYNQQLSKIKVNNTLNKIVIYRKEHITMRRREIDFNKIYTSNNSGDFKIIKEVPNTNGTKSKNRRVIIEFILTKNRTEVDINCALNGKVRDHENYRGAYIDPTKIYDSSSGPFRILKETKPNEHGNRTCDIHFENTGYECNVPLSNALRCRVRDPYFPSVNNIGYLGEPNKNCPYYEMLYNVWSSMIFRCYNTNSNRYDVYGGMGIKVSEEWLCFATFLEDAQSLPNFEYKIKYPEYYQLDKDYLQQNIPKENRVYSKDTCVWLYYKDNNFLKVLDHKNNYSGCYKDEITNGDIESLSNVYDNSYKCAIKVSNKNPQSKLLMFIENFR